MKIAIASDHGGFALKEQVKEYLQKKGFAVEDFGTDSEESVDYADYAAPACKSVIRGENDKAVLICGTGIGMSLAANKIRGMRAACVSDPFSARMAKMHNDANALCFGGRVVGIEVAKMILDEFFDHEFEGGRHNRRIDKVMALEEEKYE